MADNTAKFEIPPIPRPGARDEWEDLLQTLHESGTLRLLNGFFGRFPQVCETLLDQASSSTGQNIIGSLLVLGDFAGTIPAERLQPVVKSFRVGIERAQATFEDADPPSTRELLSLLHDKRTRRALYAGLQILNAMGEEVPQRTQDDNSE